jgi:hypothetical protein
MEHRSPRRPSAAFVLSLVSLFIALGGVSVAATGGTFILGQPNSADKTTALTVSTLPDTATCPAPCQALQVTDNSTASNAGGLGVVGRSPSTAASTIQNTGGATALRLVVNSGKPPLSVNSGAKVTSLNADQLDGLDSTGLWKLGGNAGTNPPTSFLGTTNAQPLVVKTNGGERMRIGASGDVGIGTTNPAYMLHVGVGDSGLRVEGPGAPGGTAMSIGGFGAFGIDAPGVPRGRFVVTNDGEVGIGRPLPDSALHVSTNSAGGGNNTAEFDAPAIGPNASHIHWGATGDWFIRSAANGGKVVMQDNPGNVGIGTASPGEKLSVAGTVESTGGGFKFPDGSVQSTAAPNSAYTTRSAPALDTREIADVDDPTPTELAHLALPTGTYLLMATADFGNGAATAFQDNSRLVRCTFYEEEFRFKIEPGGGGFFGRSSTSWHIVKNLPGPTTTVSLACRAYTGGTDRSFVYGNATRITAIKLPSISVQ